VPARLLWPPALLLPSGCSLPSSLGPTSPSSPPPPPLGLLSRLTLTLPALLSPMKPVSLFLGPRAFWSDLSCCPLSLQSVFSLVFDFLYCDFLCYSYEKGRTPFPGSFPLLPSLIPLLCLCFPVCLPTLLTTSAAAAQRLPKTPFLLCGTSD